ncbi:hypothetical protein [Streptomyces sp. MUM 203J]|nr:hypothetical protein [Streptomyces sp. MUM 203J]
MALRTVLTAAMMPLPPVAPAAIIWGRAIGRQPGGAARADDGGRR